MQAANTKNLDVEKIVDTLQRVEIFSNTPESVLRELANVLEEIRFNPNDQIIVKGEEGDCMYVIYEGRVMVHDGEHKIAEIGSNKIFGELSILNPEPRSASVKAIEATRLLRLHRDDFYKTIGTRTEILKGMIIMLIRRIKSQNESIIESLKEREKELEKLVDIRTAELREEKLKLEQAYEEINAQNEHLASAYLEINTQKDLLEEKNKHIQSSINYAKRIQEAILTEIQEIQRALPLSFILYKPRDVVSGDFYWYVQKDDFIVLAAVDCTGHGVPGAFMTMIGSTILNQIVNEMKIYNPGEILSKLHKGIRRALKQDDQDSKSRDGMDAALCVIYPKEKKLEYAGANRPLYYVRNGELFEIKATKSPLGGAQYEENVHFETHTVEALPETRFYVFSDGYPDQFGGTDNRKFMTKRFKELLQTHHKMPIVEQGEFLDKIIEDWRGNHAQIDDILVIGFQVS